MTEQELISMVIDEITEHKLSHYRMKNKEYKEINIELTQLGSKVQSVLSELSAGKADIINLYIAKPGRAVGFMPSAPTGFLFGFSLFD